MYLSERRRPRAVAEMTYSEHALPSNAGVLFVDQERDIALDVVERPREHRIGRGPSGAEESVASADTPTQTRLR